MSKQEGEGQVSCGYRSLNKDIWLLDRILYELSSDDEDVVDKSSSSLNKLSSYSSSPNEYSSSSDDTSISFPSSFAKYSLFASLVFPDRWIASKEPSRFPIEGIRTELIVWVKCIRYLWKRVKGKRCDSNRSKRLCYN